MQELLSHYIATNRIGRATKGLRGNTFIHLKVLMNNDLQTKVSSTFWFKLLPLRVTNLVCSFLMQPTVSSIHIQAHFIQSISYSTIDQALDNKLNQFTFIYWSLTLMTNHRLLLILAHTCAIKKYFATAKDNYVS